MSNPIAELVAWLNKQDTNTLGDIAFLVSGMHPSFGDRDMLADPSAQVKAFIEKIEEFSEGDFRSAGFLVAFRAIFDFVFVKRRGTTEAWESPKGLFEKILNSIDPNLPAGMKPRAQKWMDELPANRAHWIDVCRQWAELKESSLSDAAIEMWSEEAIKAGGNKPQPVQGIVVKA